MTTIQPRKQRLARLNAPHHQARKQMASHLADDLLRKYNRRSFTLVKGDEVKVLRGDAKGKTGRIAGVDTKHRKVTVDGVTHKKADGTEVAYPLDPSNLLITKLNLDDKRRRARLGETAEGGEAPKEKKPAKKAAEAKAPAAKVAEKATEKAEKKVEEVTA